MKNLVMAFTGPSNSGKTTLIVKLSTYLKQQGFKVCIVKHDPKDKAIFDTGGKDSYKFSQTGADVAVVSSTRTTYFKPHSSDIEDLINMFGEFDYLLVEGLKTLPLPRIAIFRNKLDENYYEVSDAIAIDNTISKQSIPNTSAYLDLNNIQMITDWIDDNAKKV